MTKWAEVDAGQLRDNAAALAALVGGRCALMAMVKANGYGHGAVTAARATLAGGATWLGVSSLTEAMELRRSGIEARILNTGWTMPAELPLAAEHRIDVSVFDPDGVAAARGAARQAALPVRVHWKIDTGMGRLGTRLGDLGPVRDALRAARADLEVAGIFTHFAAADEPTEAAAEQHSRFHDAVGRVREDFPDALIHCANSAALLRLPETHHDIVRPGIALYGYPPAGGVPVALRPALRVVARVAQVKEIEPGETVGYGRTWVAQRRTRVAAVAAGYADGVDRRNGNHGAVIVGAELCPIIGRVSMDQLTVDITEAGEVRSGDEAVIIGERDGRSIDAAAIAGSIGTIAYEVLCSISGRVPRIVVGSEEEVR